MAGVDPGTARHQGDISQAGHASIESTRIYLHLANDWLAAEYTRTIEALDAQDVAAAQ